MARLRRRSPEDPGWSRRRAGKGFGYLDETGAPLPPAGVIRVTSLVIPPGRRTWASSWSAPTTQRDAATHARLLEFGRVLSR